MTPMDPRPTDTPAAVDPELDFHVEMQVRRFVEAGLSPDVARERALRRLGNLAETREACQAIADGTETNMRRAGWWQDVRQDVSYAWRVLRRAPLFTAAAIATLAIGIGANTAIFSVVNAVLFQTVPYRDAHRLVLIWNSYAQAELSRTAIAAAEFSDFRDRQQAFDALAAIRPQPSTLSVPCLEGAACEPERVFAYAVSSSLFDLLRMTPAIGRPFTEADGVTGAERVILLSDALWRRRFNADPGVVGRSVLVGAVPRIVIGVMPAGVRFPDAPLGFLKDQADLWIPFNWEQRRADGRGNQNLAVIARTKTGVSVANAQRDLDRIAAGFRTEFPNRYDRPEPRWRIEAVSIRDQMIGDVRPALWLMAGAVGLVLLTACANVTNLLLARGTARRRELAVRTALGASRPRLIRQLFVESLALVGAGGLAAVGLAVAAIPLLVQMDPGTIPRLETATLDLRVLAFTAVLTLATALVIGLLPALRYSRVDPQSGLAGGTREGSTMPVRRRLRNALVVGEVAMAVVLLVGAGLLARSLLAMTRVEPGFDPRGGATIQVTLPSARYDTPAKVFGFHRDLTARLSALPGASDASAVYPLPMSGSGWSGTLGIEQHEAGPGDPLPHAEYAVAMPNYFKTLGIPLVEGREFADGDTATTPPVAIVDSVLAHRYWPGESAIGKRVHQGGGRPADGRPWTTVVGVVGHVRNGGPLAEGEPQIYLPALQKAELLLFYVVRSTLPIDPLPPAMREALRAIDPTLPPTRLATLPDVVAKVTAPQRFNALLLGLFGGVALLLAAVGLYGVMALLVSQQTREIGIRLALGGQPHRILRGVLSEGITMTAIGLACGLAAAFGLSRAVSGLLYSVSPADPVTYTAIAVLLLGVALAASYFPARRASRTALPR